MTYLIHLWHQFWRELRIQNRRATANHRQRNRGQYVPRRRN